MIMCGRKLDSLSLFERFVQDEDGATAIEYGLIVALVFLAILTGVKNFATQSNSMYGTIQSTLASTSP